MLNDCVNIHNKNKPRFAEIFKLAAELAERGVNFQMQAVTLDELRKVYLWYPDRWQKVALVVQGTGTAGADDGLLELDGLLTEDEAKTHADGLGYLTAGNVLERILKREGEKWTR